MKDTESRYMIPNLWRALDILEFLAREPEGKTISEVVEAINIPTNSVFRILRTLTARGYVLQQHKRYEVSSRLFALGAQAIAEETLFEKTYPVMRELRDTQKETVLLGKISEGTGVILEQIPGLFPVKVVVEVGLRFPLHSSAPGKAILAFLPIEEQKALLKDYEYIVKTPTTIRNEKQMMDELRKIREAGISYDREESDAGVRCVCCPVLNSHGYPLVAIWITGPSSRMSPETCDSIGFYLKEAAMGVSQSLGYLSRDKIKEQ